MSEWDTQYYEDEESPEPECCPNCGKEYEDFSDMGCEKCDHRHPDFGVMP